MAENQWVTWGITLLIGVMGPYLKRVGTHLVSGMILQVLQLPWAVFSLFPLRKPRPGSDCLHSIPTNKWSEKQNKKSTASVRLQKKHGIKMTGGNFSILKGNLRISTFQLIRLISKCLPQLVVFLIKTEESFSIFPIWGLFNHWLVILFCKSDLKKWYDMLVKIFDQISPSFF